MLPVLLDLNHIKLYTYGAFLVLAFFWGAFLLWRNIRLTSYREDEVFDGIFLSIGGGLLVSRLAYVALNFKDFGFDFLKLVLINGYPGLSVYGLILGFVGALALFSKARKIPFHDLVDYVVPSIFLAAAFIKIGGFLSGAEAGAETNFPLRTRYLGYEGLRHLTALYEGLLYFIGAFVSQKFIYEIRKGKYFHGFLLYMFIMFFSLTNLLFDKIKSNRLYFMGQSANLVASAAIALTIGFYLIYYFRSSILKTFRLYGQKTLKTIHSGTKVKTGGGKGKESATDRGTEKG